MIYIASDHAGFKLKEYLVEHLKNKLNLKVADMGPKEFDENDDYPDFAKNLAETVVKEKAQGILLCGSGNGVCVAANKTRGARAIVGYSIEAATLGREHNDANILCLAGRVLTEEHAAAIVRKFLGTNFSGEEKHLRRIKKIEG